MNISENKKPNKYVALATYLIAVVCLLLGLFLPLFNEDKGILALQLPDALNTLAKKQLISTKKPFTMPYPIDLFGLGKTSVDIMALIVVLYTAVALLSLLALIPIGISTKRETRTACVFMYIVEVAAVAVLSVYLIIALEYATVSYNMVIALGGSVLMLILLSVMGKGGAGVAKTVLFLLSAVGLLMLFDWFAFDKLTETLVKVNDKLKIMPAFVSVSEGDYSVGVSAMVYLQLLFEGSPDGSFSEVLKAMTEAKNKAMTVLLAVVALVAVINYIIDAAALASNGKKAGHLFNLVRYGLEFAAILCLVITVLVVKAKLGLLLIVLIAVCVIQLVMSIVRFLLYRKRRASELDDPLYEKPVKQPKQLPQETQPYEQPLIAGPAYEQTVIEEVSAMPKVETEPAQPEVEPLYEDPNAVQTVIDVPPVNEVRYAQPAQPAKPEPIVIDIVQPEPEAVEPPVYAQPAQPEYRPYEPPVRPVQPEYRAYEQPVRPAPAPTPAPAPAPAPAPDNEPQSTRVYTINTIYGGPTDEFIKKLSNDERIEFARTFIEKSNGDIGNIPEYVIGANNKKFFSSVFIYLGRIRGLISDGLLNKMYKELNMM